MSQNDIPVSKEVISYLKRKPFIQEAIEQEIVNYSALARKIAKDLGNINFEAVKSTLIRFGNKIKKDKMDREKKIINLLSQADFSINNKIAAIHHLSQINIDSISYSKTPSGYMYFVKESIAQKSHFKKIDYNFAIIHIKSPRVIEQIPGVASFILSALAFENINVAHFRL